MIAAVRIDRLERPVRFGPFRLDPERARLYRDDDVVRLRPKTWEVLCLLVANPGQLLTKQAIIDAVWEGAAVGDTMPSISVTELRRALGDDSRSPRYIETVHRRGFRFIAELRREEPGGSPPPDSLDAPVAVPFVGRAAELAELDRWMTGADPHCRIALVAGEAGIGKTSLVNAFLDRIGASNSLRAAGPIGRGHCLAHFGEGHAYLPILALLGDLCRGRDHLPRLLREVAPTWLASLPSFADPGEIAELRSRAESTSRSRVIEELAGFVHALGPAIWVLEDLHWADEATLELVTVLAENTALEGFRVVGTLRLAEAVAGGHPVVRLRRELRRRSRCREIQLAGLGEQDIAEYLSARLPTESLPNWLPERLLDRTTGNPFFLVNTVDHLLGSGALATTGATDGQSIAEALEGVPETLRELVIEQVRMLAEPGRQALRMASLGGLESDAASIAAALAAPVGEIDDVCTELSRHTPFLMHVGEAHWPDGTISGRYAFRHALYQKVLYEDQAPAARREAHRRIGHSLVASFGERTADLAALIADHFERGGDDERAVTYRLMAARAANTRQASREAALHLRRALALLPRITSDRDVREAEILAELGKVLPASQGFSDPALQDLYVRARILRAKGAEAGDEITLLIGQLLANLMQRKARPAEELARELLEMTAHAEDDRARAAAELLMGVVLYHHGDLAGTIDHADGALALAGRGLAFGPLEQECGALVMSGAALWQAGKPDDGLARALRGLDLARRAHPFNLILTLQALAAIHQWRGDVAAALEAAQELAANVRVQGILEAAAIASLIEGWAAFASGDHEFAGQRVEQGLAAPRRHGSMMQSVYLLAVAVEILCGLGRVPEAIALLDEAEQLIDDGDARWWEPELHRWRAVLVLAIHPTAQDDAERSLQRALDIAAQQGSLSLSLRAALTLGQLRQQQGRPQAAREIVAAALADIEGGAETGDVLEAKRLLDLFVVPACS